MNLRRALILTALLMATLGAWGQHVRLCGEAQRGALYVDLDELWRYNLYEHSRWGLGLKYIRQPDASRNTTLSAYVGYGVEDRQWKGGLNFSLRRGASTVHLTAAREYAAAGSRRSVAAHLSDFDDLSAFMTRRMSDYAVFVGGYRHQYGAATYAAEAHLFLGGRLFDGNGLLYRCLGDRIVRENVGEMQLQAQLQNGITTTLLAGHTWPDGKPVAQALVQYDKELQLPVLTFNFFAQGGATPKGVPYIRMFDLGGTYHAPLYFRNTLLTAAPNEFTANMFTLASLRVVASRPLWKLWSRLLQVGSYPRPFVGVSGAWGMLWGQEADGSLTYEGLSLQAPVKGIVEPVAGIEGLVRWGVVDWGVATAWRMVPAGANYRHSDWHDNLTLMLCARLAW